jgi:hypothetical protein
MFGLFLFYKMIQQLLKYRFHLWFIVAILQATFTDVFHDEAYYWLWSKHLAWGYFDHPPMIAWIIRIGTIFGDQEIFVRLVVVLMNLVFIYLLEKLVAPKNLLLFWKIILSVFVLQIGGIIAVPDLPLMFFAMLFFFLLKQYLENDSLLLVSLLAIVSAGMIYSKYHAILVLVFSLVVQPQLLKRKSFYWFVGLVILLGLPHLFWQQQHDWVSFHYHLVERSVGENLKIENTLDYIVTQLLFTGPLIGIVLLFALFRFKTKTAFEFSLKTFGVGLFVFFFLMSLKGRVESNWTNVGFIPLVYFGYNFTEDREKWKRAIHIIFCISFPLVILARVFLIYDFLPKSLQFETDFHRWKTWAKQMETKANGLPIVFMDSYQKAAKYSYYTGKEAVCLTNLAGRHNQYDLWKSDQKLFGQKVLLVLNWRDGYKDSVVTVNRTWSIVIQNPFLTYSPIEFIPEQNRFSVKPNDTLKLVFRPLHHYDSLPNLIVDSTCLPKISCQFFDEKKQIGESLTNYTITNSTFDGLSKTLLIPIPNLAQGKHQFRLSVSAGWNPAFLNSARYELIVRE